MPATTARTTAIAVVGIDIGKNSFHIVGLDDCGAIVLRQKWSRGQVEARFANMQAVDGTQHVIDGDVIVQSELIEKALLHYQPIAHHRCSLRFTAQPVNQRQSPVTTADFFNGICH
jgi:hypothetical protein